MSTSKTLKNNINLAIHSKINDLLYSSRFNECDKYIRTFNPYSNTIDELLSVLVATGPAKDKLPSRSRFYDECYPRLKDKVTTYNVLKRLK